MLHRIDINTCSETIRRYREITRCLNAVIPASAAEGLNRYSIPQVIAEYATQDEYQVAAKLKEAMSKGVVDFV